MPKSVRPPSPKGKFITGNLNEFYKNQLEFLSRCAREYGDITQLRFFHVPVYLLNNPDDIEYVMTNNTDFIKPKSIRMPFQKRIFGNGILASDGNEWLANRRLIQKVFQNSFMEDYAGNVVDLTESLTAEWQEGETIEIYQQLKTLTLKIAIKSFFGEGSLTQSCRLENLLNSLVEQLAVQGRTSWVYHNFFPTKLNTRFLEAAKQLDEFIYEMIQRERKGNVISNNLLSKLIEASNKEGIKLTDKQIRDEVITLIMASYDTTAIVLSWAFYLLAKHPEIEENLSSEITSVLGRRMPQLSDFNSLRYAQMIIKESMRLYPPNRSVGRESLKSCQIRGYKIPAKSQILMSQWIVHRDERFFAFPNDFKPGRWTDDFSRKLHKYAYFPFGGGQRICVGRHFAMIEITLILVVILGRFKFLLVAEQVIEPHPVILLRPRFGIKVNVKKR